MDSILIIDDEPQIRKLLSRMMELEGYEVFQATDCQSTLKQLKLHTPQVALCDVFLPDGHGVDLVLTMKKLYPELEIILLTAHGNIPDGVQAIKNGAFDYITKGDDNNKIIPVVSRAMEQAKKNIGEKAKSELGKKILLQLQENLKIAGEEMIPICQDTGMAVFFVEIGQDVHFEGQWLEDAINEGVRQGYTEGYLRKSVVADPILRENTKDNTPAIIHYSIVPGDKVTITFAPKGFGSENMSRIFMLKPADGIDGVKNAILTAVKDAGPNACPPLVVGVGIGGTFEKCALMAKKALTREVGKHSDIPYVRKLEEEMLEKINCLGIGPGGLGGTVTALAVNVNTYPTHIAGLPVAVNICCHVNRHTVCVL